VILIRKDVPDFRKSLSAAVLWSVRLSERIGGKRKATPNLYTFIPMLFGLVEP